MMMPKPSLFAEEDRANRRSKLGDPLVGLSKHVDKRRRPMKSIPPCRARRVQKAVGRRIRPS